MFIPKSLPVAFPAYLIFVYMLVCTNTSECLSQQKPRSGEIVHLYRLYSDHSKKLLEIKGPSPTANGSETSKFTILEFRTREQRVNTTFTRVAFTIMGLKTKRYLCFNKKGRLISKYHKWNSPLCLFEDRNLDDYWGCHLLYNKTCNLAFNRQGKALHCGIYIPHRRHQSNESYKFMQMPYNKTDEFSTDTESEILAERVSNKSPTVNQPSAHRDHVAQREHKKRKHNKSKKSTRRRRSRTTPRPSVSITSSLVPRPAVISSNLTLASVKEDSLVRIRREDQGLIRTLRLLKLMA